jgi:hypothetical protein
MAFPLSTLKPQPPTQFRIVNQSGQPVQAWSEYMITVDRTLRTVQQIALATPNNANARAAGVPLGGLYTTTADPAIVYIRTV